MYASRLLGRSLFRRQTAPPPSRTRRRHIFSGFGVLYCIVLYCIVYCMVYYYYKILYPSDASSSAGSACYAGRSASACRRCATNLRSSRSWCAQPLQVQTLPRCLGAARAQQPRGVMHARWGVPQFVMRARLVPRSFTFTTHPQPDLALRASVSDPWRRVPYNSKP